MRCLISIRIVSNVVPLLSSEKKLLLIDLRSPKEYAKGHISGARNLPLLDNEERHIVGTLYKTEGKAVATEEGLSFFAKKAQNFLQHIEDWLLPETELLLYCWRGGMRSTMVARWLSVMGISVQLLKGGYKRYRSEVLSLVECLGEHPLIVLNGKTGSGKTELIEQLIKNGLAAIDLEGMAKHRGSVFGDLGQQYAPATQQQFENDLALAYYPLRKAPRIAIELETALGPVFIAEKLRKNMQHSPMVFLERDINERVAALISTYTKTWDQAEESRFILRLQGLAKNINAALLKEIENHARAKDFTRLTKVLLEERYDKCYQKSLARHEKQMLRTIDFAKDSSSISYFRELLLQPASLS